MSTNFDLAPPPVTFEGKTAVPIDISAIDARLTFDGATRTASGDATLTFVVGSAAGRPMFNLRQTITAVWLDGVPVALGQVLTRDLGGGAGAELRVLDVPLDAGSSHTLRIAYSLGLPASPAGGSYPPGLAWSAGPRLDLQFWLYRSRRGTLSGIVGAGEFDLGPIRRQPRHTGDGYPDRTPGDHQRNDYGTRNEPLARRVSRSRDRPLDARGSARERHAVLVVDDGDAARQRTFNHRSSVQARVQHGPEFGDGPRQSFVMAGRE